MKEHFCPAEQSMIAFEKECNWCGEQEPQIAFNAEVVGYIAPQRTWVGLTDEEIKPCWHEACQTDLELTSQLVVYFAKAIEAKLKEKNT